MVGGSGLSMLLLGAIGVIAGSAFGFRLSWVFLVPGALLGAILGVVAGAFGWGLFDEWLEKCRTAFNNKQYLAGSFWLTAALVTLLFSFGGMLWFLYVAFQ